MPEYCVQVPDFTVGGGFCWLRERCRLIGGTAPGLLCTKYAGFRIVHESIFSPGALLDAVAMHQANLESGNTVKVDVKRRISRSCLNGMPVVVKEYRRLHRWRFFSPDQRGWLGARRLRGSCRVVAWLRAQDASVAYVIMEDAGARDLILKNGFQDAPEAPALFRAAGVMMGRLHNAGIYHADCKASNFVVREHEDGGFALELIDCDDVRRLRISKARRAKNLAQFLGAQEFMSDYARLLLLTREFIAGYRGETGLAADAMKAILNRICPYSDRIYPERAETMARLTAEVQEAL